MKQATTSEKRLWLWLCAAYRENGNHSETLHMERIENLVGVGNPDVTGCLNGHCFDIELKTADRPARATTPVIPRASLRGAQYIRPAQKNWHIARWKAGGQCYFLIQVGRDERYLIPGSYARSIEGWTEDQLAGASVMPERYCTPLEVVKMAASYRSFYRLPS